jgi:glycosyltransferase involved in cell wall biosynthesis
MSIVVPVFNNSESLEILINELEDVLSDIGILGTSEVIFVDDGSQDQSFSKLSSLSHSKELVIRVVKLAKNFGQVNAWYAGYFEAKGECIVTISADLQDPTSLISNFFEEYEKGFELAFGHRVSRNESWYRRLTSKIAYKVAKYGNPGMPKGGFDYFLMSDRVKNILLNEYPKSNFVQGALVSMGLSFSSIGYERKSRPYGKSGWTLRKKSRLLLDILFESSTTPLRIMYSFGLLIIALGTALLFYVIYGKVTDQTPFNGFTLLFGSLLVFNGLIFLFLGVISEYLVIFFNQSSSRKRFLIEKRIGFKD